MGIELTEVIQAWTHCRPGFLLQGDTVEYGSLDWLVQGRGVRAAMQR
jgi:hypothetical protein